MNILAKSLSAAGILFATVPAFGAEPMAVPEPSLLGLLVAGGIAGAIIAIRKRRK
ncbi:MAG: PEP-CTERM sorting domain-containing protein [Gammaproteobacteria bacterium]|jgi:hypothetical protein